MEKKYGPDIRISDKTTKAVENYNKVNNTNIPNPKTDPIVVNNIAWMEFDYTEDCLKDYKTK